jgi:hypothetical protein
MFLKPSSKDITLLPNIELIKLLSRIKWLDREDISSIKKVYNALSEIGEAYEDNNIGYWISLKYGELTARSKIKYHAVVFQIRNGNAPDHQVSITYIVELREFHIGMGMLGYSDAENNAYMGDRLGDGSISASRLVLQIIREVTERGEVVVIASDNHKKYVEYCNFAQLRFGKQLSEGSLILRFEE